MNQGNTFDKRTVQYGHARKVWREVFKVEPGGGTISNVADWVSAGIIPPGTPVKFDNEDKTIEAFTDAEVAAATADPSTLGINGMLKEEVHITSANTVATGTVVYEGEIYEYMIKAETLAELKKLSTIGGIKFVQ